MKQKFSLKTIVVGFMAMSLMLTSVTSCKDYDDDINSLENRVTSLEASVKALQAKVDAGKYVTAVATHDDGITVTFSDGTSQNVTVNGKAPTITVNSDGDLLVDGTVVGNIKGPKGDTGASGADIANNVTIDPTTKEILVDGAGTGVILDNISQNGSYVTSTATGYTLNVWNSTTNAYETISLPKGSNTVTGITYVPHQLSGGFGEAKQVWFPVIVTDSLYDPTGASLLDIGYQLFKDNALLGGAIPGGGGSPSSLTYTSFSSAKDRLYSGKVNLDFAFSPTAVDPTSFELDGMAAADASLSTYSKDDDEVMLFNKGEAMYSGVYNNISNLTDGVYSLRAKAWHFGEILDFTKRTSVALKIKNGENMVQSEYIPTRRHAILQKYLYITTADHDLAAFNSTTKFYWTFTSADANALFNAVTDPYLYKSSNTAANLDPVTATNPFGEGLTTARRAEIDALPENVTYRPIAPSFEIPLGTADAPGTLNLKEKLKIYYRQTKSTGELVDPTDLKVGDEGKIVILNNGEIIEDQAFDDFTLEFELVKYFNEGVDQTSRYLDADKSKDGVITVKSHSAIEQTGELHTAAIGRTPMVRVKMIAPKEDNYAVVKTALIKLVITNKAADLEDIDVEYDVDFVLKSINQENILDMDRIFNMDEIQLSKAQFKEAYTFDDIREVAVTAYPVIGPTEYVTSFVHEGTYTTDHYTDGDYTPVHRFGVNPKLYGDQVILDDISTNNTTLTNTLVTYGSPLMFEGTYTIKTRYTLKDPNGPYKDMAPKNINLTVNVTNSYPAVKAPEKTPLNWTSDYSSNGTDQVVATGRIGGPDVPPTNNTTDKSYEMIQDLHTSFDLASYEGSGVPANATASNTDGAYATAYKGLVDQTYGPVVARPTFSFELADELFTLADGTTQVYLQNVNANRAAATGYTSGITLTKAQGDHDKNTATPDEWRWELGLEPTDAGRKFITKVKFNTSSGKYDYVSPKVIKFNTVMSFNEWIDANYGNYGIGEVKYSKNASPATTHIGYPIPTNTADYVVKPFGDTSGGSYEFNSQDNYINVVTDYNNYFDSAAGVAEADTEAPRYGRAKITGTYETFFPTPLRLRPDEDAELVDKYEDANNENKIRLDTLFILTDYLYTDGILEANKPKHIIYDYSKAGLTVGGITYSADGWYENYRLEFEAQKAFSYEIGDAYYEANPSTPLDATNKARFSHVVTGGVDYLTWDNNGADITQNVIVEIKVTFIHKWGEDPYTPSTALTYDTGTLGSSTYVVPVKLVPHK